MQCEIAISISQQARMVPPRRHQNLQHQEAEVDHLNHRWAARTVEVVAVEAEAPLAAVAAVRREVVVPRAVKKNGALLRRKAKPITRETISVCNS
ncbi:MAG: hypothetical protein GY816_22380 [Cytophagales bacterium]|nr:hypothetical protein [Cytophagales bacterium]